MLVFNSCDCWFWNYLKAAELSSALLSLAAESRHRRTGSATSKVFGVVTDFAIKSDINKAGLQRGNKEKIEIIGPDGKKKQQYQMEVFHSFFSLLIHFNSLHSSSIKFNFSYVLSSFIQLLFISILCIQASFKSFPSASIKFSTCSYKLSFICSWFISILYYWFKFSFPCCSFQFFALKC